MRFSYRTVGAAAPAIWSACQLLYAAVTHSYPLKCHSAAWWALPKKSSKQTLASWTPITEVNSLQSWHKPFKGSHVSFYSARSNLLSIKWHHCGQSQRGRCCIPSAEEYFHKLEWGFWRRSRSTCTCSCTFMLQSYYMRWSDAGMSIRSPATTESKPAEVEFTVVWRRKTNFVHISHHHTLVRHIHAACIHRQASMHCWMCSVTLETIF